MTLPAHLTLELVTPERSVALETVDEVEIPGIDGYLGVLPGHTPLLVALKVGELWYRQGEERTFVSVAFGFAEVLPDDPVVLLPPLWHLLLHPLFAPLAEREQPQNSPVESFRKGAFPLVF